MSNDVAEELQQLVPLAQRSESEVYRLDWQRSQAGLRASILGAPNIQTSSQMITRHLNQGLIWVTGVSMVDHWLNCHHKLRHYVADRQPRSYEPPHECLLPFMKNLHHAGASPGVNKSDDGWST